MKHPKLQKERSRPIDQPTFSGTGGSVSRSVEIIFPVLIILLTLIPYCQTASFGFVNFDDPSYVYQNPLLTEGLSSDRVKDAVFGFHQGNWHPLVWLSYMAEVAIFGMKPQVMHITNVLLHIANSLLLYFWLRRVTEDPVRCFLAALIFAIHPLHVESVAWITERKDVLSSLFLLATLIAYSEYVRKHSRWWYLAAVILFALGLTAKGMLVTLPVVLVLLDFWPLNRFQIDSVVKFDHTTLRGILVDKIPFVVLSVMIASITIVAQRSGGAVAGITAISLDGRLANSVVSVSRYLFRSVWPMHLGAFYPMRTGGWGPLIVSVSLTIFVLITATTWAFRNRRLPVLIGWAWFIITLLPVIGIIQVGSQSIADRYTYVPMIGLSMMLLWGFPDKYFRLSWARIAVASIPGAALLYLTTQQVTTWRDSITLFEHALSVDPANNFTSHANLGMAYRDAGQMEDAKIHLDEALKLNPANADEVGNLALSYIREGKYKDAEDLLIRALQAHKDNSTLWLYLGNAMKNQREWENAILSYRRAVDLNPDSSEALNNLGLMICRTKNSEGLQYIRKAIEANPQNAQAHNSLGNALVREGNLEEAQKSYLEAIRLADLSESKQNLEYVRELLGQQATPQ